MIKTSNDLLGFLIKHADENGDVPASAILNDSGCDDFIASELLRDLSGNRYVITTMDTVTVTSLGRINYVSKAKAFVIALLKLLVLGIKELVVFGTGLATGLAINYFTKLLIG